MPKLTGWALGVALIVAVAAIWALASVLVQYIYDNAHFERPFTLTYIATSLFVIYLPFWEAGRRLGFHESIPWQHEAQPFYAINDSDEVDEASSHEHAAGYDSHSSSTAAHSSPAAESSDLSETALLIVSSGSGDDDQEDNDNSTRQATGDASIHAAARNFLGVADEAPTHATHVRLAHRELLYVGACMCGPWFLANWTYNVSLSMTSVTSSTVLASTSSVFALLFGNLLAHEPINLRKGFASLLCIGGSTIVALADKNSDSDHVKHSVSGDFICIFSAAMYGLYTSILKRLCPEDGKADMTLILGYMGLCNMVVLAPVLLGLGLATQEVAGLTASVFGLLLAKGLVDNVLSDYLWAKSVVLTSPAVATIGLSLTIPFAFLTDGLFHAQSPSLLSILGGVIVIVSFVIVNI
eukprot:m.53632 g.53632  ORF g.53632 m.53632 type:complete len:411 (+) comp6777_c1_seq1:86-1318(+)